MVVLFTGTAFFSLLAQNNTTPRIRTEPFEGSTQEAIKYLEALAGWVVSYSSRLSMKEKVVLDSEEKTLLEHLHTVFFESPFDYIVKNKRIILKPSEATVAKQYTVSGYISDARTGERLPSASIYNPENYWGTVSNNYGYFSITFPEGICRLKASYVGYTPQIVQFTLTEDTTLNINLVSTLQLKEISVTANRFGELKNIQGMGIIVFPIEEIKERPALMGEADLIKNIQMLPGIQGGSEGFSGIYVRGGGPDQNLLLLDDVPVYNIGHLLGFFSIFNADAVSHVGVLKGGFPARYGGRLSSVIDVRMAEGNREKIKGSVNLGVLSSGITLNGPIKKEKTGFALSFRRTYVDAIAGILQRNDDEKSNYYFYDFNGKLNYTFNNRSRIYLSSYWGRDRYYTTYNYVKILDEQGRAQGNRNDENSAEWGNLIFALRWNYLFSNKFFANATLTYSNYDFNIGTNRNNHLNNEWSSIVQEFESGIQDFNLKLDFDYYHRNGLLSKFGIQTIQHYFNPGYDIIVRTIGDEETRSDIPEIGFDGWEHHAYYENEFSIRQRLNINAGGRMILFKGESKYYLSAEPRLALRYILTPKINLRASVGTMSQFIHMATSSSISLPTDIWLPVTDKIPPKKAVQTVAGVDIELDNAAMYSLSIDVYRKWLSNIIHYRESTSFFDNSSEWEDKFTLGNGSSTGVELLFRKNRGKLTGWIGYTIAKTANSFAELNGGIEFPDRYDRRHDVGITASYRFNDKFDVGAMWMFGSGMPITLSSEKFYAPDIPFMDSEKGTGYSENSISINESRMPAFHRLDIGFNYHRQKNKTVREWGIGIINAYARNNPYMLYYSNSGANQSGAGRTIEQLSIFSFPIPYLKYTFRF